MAPVLEIGTGSGYQTAVLSRLCLTVYSMDFLPALADSATARSARLGFDNFQIRSGNGHEGWPEYAPYDGIIVTAAASDAPDPLLEQLKPGRNMVIPVGLPERAQSLLLVHKDEQETVRVRDVIGVAFVPLITTMDVAQQ
jgi:protein-L-isoaspartate(D-aspartate) O-methyltransferase